MRNPHVVFTVLGVICTLAVFVQASGAQEGAEPTKPLKMLRKIYLSVHSGGDFNDVCLVREPRPRGCDQWPGRTEQGAAAELEFLAKYRQLIREAKEDEGIFFLPTGMKSDNELIELARQHFGDRCVVWKNRPELLGDDWKQGLAEDHQQAIENRGPNLAQMEINEWGRFKGYAVGLQKQLELQGYTFDPAEAEFVAFGGDWMYCCGSYPIHMARAWGLAKGITRPFDLILKDESPLFMTATVVDDNLPMPENIDLFIMKTADEGPTWGRYIAQYYERAHGLMDPPHVVEVDFPPDSVEEINIFGWGIGRALGIGGQYDSRTHMTMSVGCGGHTPHAATVVMAKESLPLEDFRAALMAGKVHNKSEAP